MDAIQRFLTLPPGRSWDIALVGLVVIVGLLIALGLCLRRSKRLRADQLQLSQPDLHADGSSRLSRVQLESEFAKRKREIEGRRMRVDSRLSELGAGDLETASAESVVSRASTEEQANLATVLGNKDTPSAGRIVDALCRAGSHVVGNLVRRGQPIAYREVVLDVMRKMGATPSPTVDSISVLEGKVVEIAFQKVLDSATPGQREAILRELAKSSGTGAVGVATGALVLGHLSGFALYTAASTVLAALTGAFGLTLPFAAYMGVSSALATIMGPIGWIAVSAWAIYKVGGPDFKKTIPGVIAVAAMRSRLIAERDREIATLTAERDQAIAGESDRLARLKKFIDDMPDSALRSELPEGF